jgi:hypothetical protein
MDDSNKQSDLDKKGKVPVKASLKESVLGFILLVVLVFSFVWFLFWIFGSSSNSNSSASSGSVACKEGVQAFYDARQLIKESLKSPSTADFAGVIDSVIY